MVSIISLHDMIDTMKTAIEYLSLDSRVNPIFSVDSFCTGIAINSIILS